MPLWSVIVLLSAAFRTLLFLLASRYLECKNFLILIIKGKFADKKKPNCFRIHSAPGNKGILPALKLCKAIVSLILKLSPALIFLPAARRTAEYILKNCTWSFLIIRRVEVTSCNLPGLFHLLFVCVLLYSRSVLSHQLGLLGVQNFLLLGGSAANEDITADITHVRTF
jgi:hypothetical protein